MFDVTPIAAFNDNYIWVIKHPSNNQVAVVDPGDAKPVNDYLQATNSELAAILITHHHNDHTGGVNELNQQHNIPVYGPENSPFTGISHTLSDGEEFQLFGKTLQVKTIPGHTLDHISYYSTEETPQLFCGDTLFLAGCGRLFEGTPQQMLEAMQYFLTLPNETQVFCTHEYSLANLAFAKAVEPDNTSVTQAIDKCSALREKDIPTLPTSIGQEKSINPFMRTQLDSIAESARNFSAQPLTCEVEIFAAIREWKNQF